MNGPKDGLIWDRDELGPCKYMPFDMDFEDLRFKINYAPENNNSCKDPFSQGER